MNSHKVVFLEKCTSIDGLVLMATGSFAREEKDQVFFQITGLCVFNKTEPKTLKKIMSVRKRISRESEVLFFKFINHQVVFDNSVVVLEIYDGSKEKSYHLAFSSIKPNSFSLLIPYFPVSIKEIELVLTGQKDIKKTKKVLADPAPNIFLLKKIELAEMEMLACATINGYMS